MTLPTLVRVLLGLLTTLAILVAAGVVPGFRVLDRWAAVVAALGCLRRFPWYDEVGHHSGVERYDSVAVLRRPTARSGLENTPASP